MEPNPPYRRRGTTAKRLLLLIFVMMRATDALVFYFTYHTPHPVPAMRGNIFILVLWTTVFSGAMWMRKRWARYALLVCICYLVFISSLVFTTVIPMWMSVGTPLILGPVVASGIQLAAYFVSAVILIRSRAIKSYCDRA